MRFLLTNDDGIDSVGLHVLARAIQDLGEVTVLAPNRNYSGCGTSLMNGDTFETEETEVRRVHIDGVNEAYSVTGPPAFCVSLAALGMFGKTFDMVVSGINLGLNVSKSLQHSGTIGACLTAREAGISGIAVSQASNTPGRTHSSASHKWGTAQKQQWETAAAVAKSAAQGLANSLQTQRQQACPQSQSQRQPQNQAQIQLSLRQPEPVVLNINVPNLELSHIRGQRRTRLGGLLPRTPYKVTLTAKTDHQVIREHQDSSECVPQVSREDHKGTHQNTQCETLATFTAKVARKSTHELPPADTDLGAVMRGYVSVNWLSRITSITANLNSCHMGAEANISELLSV